MTYPKESGARTEVGPHNTIGMAMEDRPEVEGRVLKKELEEEMVTPNLTPRGLVKFMDVTLASKYGNDLTNFTRTITEEVHSTLDTFKTDLQNMFPLQIRSMVQ
jgi:hypothetical protein